MNRTHQELAVAALPGQLQSYMARCALAGWRIRRGQRLPEMWTAADAYNPQGTKVYRAWTLRLLLEKMIDNGEMKV